MLFFFFFFFQAEDGIRDLYVTGVQTCALPIWRAPPEVRGQPVEPVQDRERGVEQRVGGVIPRRRDAEQPRRVPGRAGQELGPFRRRRRDQRGLEQLADQAIRE